MGIGSLVPFMKVLALPGDTINIQLDSKIMTHPTIGPLFGSYKVQLDVFQVPIRLYNAMLHMNMLGIGMKMEEVKFPQIKLEAERIKPQANTDNEQINASSIFSYLNIRGLGQPRAGVIEIVRNFNAIPFLAYWDIYKNYYANKQEEIGVVIHNKLELPEIEIKKIHFQTGNE